MNKLSLAIRAHSQHLDNRQGQPRFGTVTSVDGTRAAVRVRIQPEGTLTGWLPLLSNWVGAGWGAMSVPSPGDQVFIVPQEGNPEHGVVIGAAYSTKQQPLNVPVGEYWLVHQSGASLKLSNDGTIRISGDLHVSGDVYDRHGSLVHLRDIYNQHTHSANQQGITSIPHQMDQGND